MIGYWNSTYYDISFIIEVYKGNKSVGIGIADLCNNQAFGYECCIKKYYFHFSTKTYVVVTRKNRLNETVLLSTQNICLN